MSRRRIGAKTGAQKRAEKLLKHADTSKNIYYRCFVCGREPIINGVRGDNLPEKKRRVTVGPFLICLNCKFGNQWNWGRQWVQMFLLLKRAAKMGCTATASDREGCKCVPCTARRLTASMEEERGTWPNKLYRKKPRVDPADVQVQA